MKIAMIVAMDESGFIGKGGSLPWRMSSDLKRFKELTSGDGFNAVVMGRKTWDSLPDEYRPLPERTNIVMSRDSGLQIEGAEVALYDGRAVEIGYSEGCDELWVIGGAEIYELMIQRCEEIHVTTVHTSVEGDARFPDWDRSQWAEDIIEKNAASEHDEYASTYSIWRRI